MEEIKNELTEIFKRVFRKENIELKDELNANDIDTWTSMTNIVLLNEIEKKYELEFHFLEVMDLNNVGELIKLIDNKLNRNS